MIRHGLLPSYSKRRFVSEQGTKMGRRSLLHVRITGEQGEERIDVGGHVAQVGEGCLRYHRAAMPNPAVPVITLSALLLLAQGRGINVEDGGLENRCVRFSDRRGRHRSLNGQVNSILIESGHRLSRAIARICGSSVKGCSAKNRYLRGGRIWSGSSRAIGVDRAADRDNFRDNPDDNRLPVTAVVVYA
jgi:hypothetical protein